METTEPKTKGSLKQNADGKLISWETIRPKTRANYLHEEVLSFRLSEKSEDHGTKDQGEFEVECRRFVNFLGDHETKDQSYLST